MRFTLRFAEPTDERSLYLPEIAGPDRNFPFMHTICYSNTHLDIQRHHYDKESIQIDRYLTQNDAPYGLDIESDSPSYVLIALYKGELQYTPLHRDDITLTLYGHQCRMLYAAPGTFRARLIAPHNDFLVISIAPEILYLMREEFEQLIRFMETSVSAILSAMDNCEMDQVFEYRLQRIIDVQPMRYKDYNAHLLRELSALLSAYKGLIEGKDRNSHDEKLLNRITVYIDDELAQYRNVTVSAICDTFPISPRRLERLFIERKSCTVMTYVREHKIRLIAELLQRTDRTPLELALLFGYSEIKSLDRAFRKIMGTSLSKYRKQ